MIQKTTQKCSNNCKKKLQPMHKEKLRNANNNLIELGLNKKSFIGFSES